MKRQYIDTRWLCCASIVVASLSGCSPHSAKLKNSSIRDNTSSTSTSQTQDHSPFQTGKNSHHWLSKKSHPLTVGGNVKSSSQYDKLWDRLFDLYDLPPIEHESIDRELNWFVRHPEYIDRVQSRAEPFLYSIVKQVEKKGIPGEIALLPAIESAFQPHAVSPANAAGIWQFIPSTGRIYGLKHSRTYDGRRDIYASTKAAIKYLRKLHNDFDGDWLLAIAAYNCGEGAVGRAVQRNLAHNLPIDFWSLSLPQETRSYVPRLLAISRLFADSERYGIDLHPIPNSARFKPVKLNARFDLAIAADAADISLEQLHALNPGFKGQFSDVEGSYHLFIPAGKKASEFRQELERLASEKKGGTLSFGTSMYTQDRSLEKRVDSSSSTHEIKQENAFTPVSFNTTYSTSYQTEQPIKKALIRREIVVSESEEPSTYTHSIEAKEPSYSTEAVEPPLKKVSFVKETVTSELEEPTAPPSATLESKEPSSYSAEASEPPTRKTSTETNISEEPVLRTASLESKEPSSYSAEAPEPPTRKTSTETNTSEEPMVYDAPSDEKEPSLQEDNVVKETVRSKSMHQRESRPFIKKTEEIVKKTEEIKPHMEATQSKMDRHHHGVISPAQIPLSTAFSTSQKTTGKKSTYTVQPGDTLWAVARMHSIDVKQLAKWNDFSEETEIKAGQTLRINSASVSTATKGNTGNAFKKGSYSNSKSENESAIPSKYTVRQGDTLFSISKRFKVSMTDLRKWNGPSVVKQIQPGKSITVQE